MVESEDGNNINDEIAPRGEDDVLDDFLRGGKDTWLKTKARAPMPPVADEMPEICLHCAGDVCFFSLHFLEQC